MLRDDYLVKQLRLLLEKLAQAVGLLDAGKYEAAGALAANTVDDITSACGRDWLRVNTTTLLSLIDDVERSRALARALWIVSTADEAAGRLTQARIHNRRAMELYARLRVEPERLDARAARELAGASFRLRKLMDDAEHAKRGDW